MTYFFLQDNYTISLAVLLYRENPVNKTKQFTTVYDALVRVSGKPKSGRFKCPAHQGKGYNLAIRDSTNKVELTCFSQGCETKTILKSIYLTLRDIYYRNHSPSNNSPYQKGLMSASKVEIAINIIYVIAIMLKKDPWNVSDDDLEKTKKIHEQLLIHLKLGGEL